MARKRRTKQQKEARRLQQALGAPEWRWRTLPVWLAFTGGFIVAWYVYLIGSGGANPGLVANVLFYLALIGFSVGLSRITSRLVVRWRLRRLRQAQVAPQARKESQPTS
jgi:hypothetical protein